MKRNRRGPLLPPSGEPVAQGRSTTEKAFRFALVGSANTLIDIAVFGLAMWLGAIPLAANALGWAVAVSFSFVANRRFTFEPSRRLAASFVRFVAAGALVTLVITTAGVGLLAGWIGLWPAKLAGTALAMVVNFIAARWSIEGRRRSG